MRHPTAVVSMTCLLALAGVARGQDNTADGADAGRAPVFRLNLRGLHYFSADLDEDATDSGDVSVSRFGPLASLEIPIGEVSSITIAGEFTYSFYDFDGTGLFEDDNELLSDAYELGLSATWSSRLGDEWTYFIGGGGRLSAESGADTSDALTARVFGGLGYRVSDQFTIGAGVGVSTELDDDVLVVPFLSAFYQINDDWWFGAGGGPAAAGRTLGATLTWQAQPDLGVSLTGAWDRREFRLADDGPIPDGIATDSRVDVVLGVNWGVVDRVTLRVEAGASVWQEYEFEDEDGDEVLDTGTDPSAFVGASIGFEF